MKRIAGSLYLALMLLASGLNSGQVQAVGGVTTRQKPGPVTLRGIARGWKANHFSLTTRTHGSYDVVVLSATQFLEKGVSGTPKLHEGDHVGVHGFVFGREIRAMSVRIYPVKLKPIRARGVVAAINGSRLTLDVSGHRLPVTATAQTVLRVGASPIALSQVHAGDRVEASVQAGSAGNILLRLRVFRSRSVLRHVTLRGSVSAVDTTSLTVVSGSTRTVVRIVKSTLVLQGSAHARSSDIKVGASVTIYACCGGRSLQATSIHLHRLKSVSPETTLRGRLIGVSSSRMQVMVNGKTVTVGATTTTRYEIGSTVVSATAVRIGDEVSIRARESGGRLFAVRLHIYASSRRTRTIRGAVVAVSGGSLLVLVRGVRYTVTMEGRAAIRTSSGAGRLSALRPGDALLIVGRITGQTTILASAITVSRNRTRVRVKLLSVRGVLAVSGTSVAIVDGNGKRYSIRLERGGHFMLHSVPAPSSALFSGVPASARGIIQAGALITREVKLAASIHTLSGRLVQFLGGVLTVSTRSGTREETELIPGLLPADGSHRFNWGAIGVGAFLEMRAYRISGHRPRAFSVVVRHPQLHFSALVSAPTPSLTVRTSRGDVFVLRISSGTVITESRIDSAIAASDIPAGTRVHVEGVVGRDGQLAATNVNVRLSSVTLRGQITIVSAHRLAVDAGSGAISIRVWSGTEFMQATHALAPSDLVVGDDVTVYGYALNHGSILARKLNVHRRIVGLTGSVATVDSSTFELDAADGRHRVVLTPATAFAFGNPSDIAVGFKLHVSGYLRGDGSVLANSVRFLRNRL